jgi:hypothetical protein
MPRKSSLAYQRKFAPFIRMLAEAKAQGALSVLVHHPQVLGDTYAELVESLNRLAAAELALRILPPSQREPSAPYGRD